MKITCNIQYCNKLLRLDKQQQQRQQQRQRAQIEARQKQQLEKEQKTIQRQHHSLKISSNKERTSVNFALLFCHMLLLLLSTTVPSAHADWLMDCGDCHCKWNSGKKTADCKNLSLASVPENLSSEVQVLDLSLNRIPYLEQNAFLTAQLQNLHKLFIRNSSLQRIDPRTFTQLEILIELDLSNNLLRSLQPNLFARLVKVRALVLNGNLLETLSDGIFQNLKYLHKVELKHNRLTSIGTQAFINVPLLSQIYLDGNRLNFLRKESFETLKRLTALDLDQNPWNCTCELQVFRDFVLKRNLYTPPTACYYPVHLRGMLWVEDQPEAFACKPRIIYPARGASINTSKENVTLICRVHASPNTVIAWDYNKQMYRANAAAATTSGVSSSCSGCGIVGVGLGQQQRVHIQLLRDEQSKEKEFGRDIFISRLTILGAEKSDEGIYTCLAENAGGKDAVQMSLLVQKPSPRDLLLQGNLVIVIALMALGLLSVSVFLAMITCCIYKRFKVINPNHQHHHHHRHHHHQQLDVTDQLTPAGGDRHITTTVTGGTDVGVGSGSVGDDTSVHNYKHQLQKTTNKTTGDNGTVRSKYAEVIKHGGVGGGVTLMDNGGLVGVGVGGGVGGGQKHAEQTYLERSAEDTLHIKYPHGTVATSQAEINRTTMNNSSSSHNIIHSNKIASKRQHTETNGIMGSGELGIGIAGCGGGRNGEYQPDLLPAYNNNSKANNNPQGQLYSPIKTTRTINLQEDQQQQHQQHQQLVTTTTSHSHAPKSKYNISAQEYLQSRYGSSTLNNNIISSSSSSSKQLNEKSNKYETPGLSLTTSASLSTAVGYANVTAVAAASATSASQESGFSTLQRHSKSLALPASTRSSSNNIVLGNTCFSLSSHTPTENIGSSSYEYRQPPPPPYNATHRTASGLLLQQRRTSSSVNDDSENNATKNQGYRDMIIGGGDMSISSSDAPPPPAPTGVATTRQTIVTASPSLNFLTTTGYTTPQRQLL